MKHAIPSVSQLASSQLSLSNRSKREAAMAGYWGLLGIGWHTEVL